jgi:spermidine synthase
LHPQPSDVLDSTDAAALRQLSDYWRARGRFLAIGVHTLEQGNPRDLITEIAPKLIEVVRMSGDFDAAYMPIIAMARQLGLRDPKAARRLLEALDLANPARPEARRLLASLPPG